MIDEVTDSKTIPGTLVHTEPLGYNKSHSVLAQVERDERDAISSGVSQEMFIQSIRSKWGNISSVAKELGLPRHYVEERVKNDLELWQEMVNANEMRLDLVEDSIFDKAIGGDMRAAGMYMEANGKHRGWGKETKNLNVGLNVNDLSVEELQKIVRGEIPESMK